MDEGRESNQIGRLRIRGKRGMSVHEIYDRDRARVAARWCKRMLTRLNRRIWRQSLSQGFGGETPKIHGSW